ncbi:unnamed protein product [Musa banksii]
MEFTHGIRDRLSTTDRREEQVEVSTHLPFNPSYPLPSSSSTAFRWHDDSSGAGDCASTEKEHMFYKVVTPSDVGKLNRLVIPKQHAEKYFPLDTSANEKGLLLSFEDRTGKPWRFRYSYWSSSQSYVMTKGWSRFVKEKGLQAGDTISFGRGVGDAGRHRLFIDWKRRPENRDPPRIPLPELSFARSAGPWSGRLLVPPEAGCGHTWQGHTYPAASLGTGGGQCLYYSLPAARPPQMEVQQAGRIGFPMVLGSPLPLVRNQPAVKRVRLFGVTLDCPESGGGVNYDGHSHSVRVPQLHPGAALPLLQSPGTAGESTPSGSSSVYKKQHSQPDL